MDKKKVVGFSFGRKLSNTEILIKEALLECEAAGMEIQFIRCDDLDVHICTGCCACVAGLAMKKGSGKCVHANDDFNIIHEALMSSDAVIVGSPTYVLSPTGNFKKIVDRMGPSHDITFVTPAIEAGIAENRPKDTYPDERFLKKRVAALITVGGARTENWLSFAMPTMYEFTMSMGMDVIDKYQYSAAMDWDSVLGRPDAVARAKQIGRNIVEALRADTEEERTRYRCEERPGVCPVCHESMLTIEPESTTVECPICGIAGTLEVVDGKVKATFSEEQQKRSRLFEAGKWEHSNEIRDGIITGKHVKNLTELKKKYIGVGE